ncbi:hypothetical protein D3C75_798330 [compost metagenome]
MGRVQISGVYALGRMRIHRPPSIGNYILEMRRLLQIGLCQQVFSDKAAGFSFSRNIPEPVYSPILRLRVIAAIFDMIPDTQHNRQQFIADGLIVRDRVQHPAELDPPVTVLPGMVTAEFQILLRKFPGPRGRCEIHGTAHIPGGKQKGRALPVGIGVFARQRLAILA